MAGTDSNAGRRGKRIAAVALALRLAGILYAMWRDGVPNDVRRIRGLWIAAAEGTARAGLGPRHHHVCIEKTESGAASALNP